VFYQGKEYGVSSGFGSLEPSNNMSDFSIMIEVKTLTNRQVNDFSASLDLTAGNFNGLFTAPESSTGVAYYDINVKNFEIAGTGRENPFTITNVTTREVLFNDATVQSTGGNLQFQIPSGNQFQINIQQDPTLTKDVFEYTGTESVGQ
jgi:hypothetical protein